ncbi:MAG: DNA polymerase II [Nanoarchaeota archaeon]|nr:DNA polymerase II [Nanoarchaeota archaeon]
MKAFVVYSTYRTVRDGSGKETAQVHLYGRMETGESFQSISDFRPYFWIKKSDLTKAKKIDQFDTEDPGFKDFSGNAVIRIILNTPNQVPKLRQQLEDKDIKCYEADVRFPYRFMMDNGILGSCEITGKYEKGDYVDRIYINPGIRPAQFTPKLKILSIDIETDLKGKTLFALSMHTEGYSHVFIISNKKLNKATSFKDEKQLLEAFTEKVKELDPDIITGWNVIDFDLSILQSLYRKHGLDFWLGREPSSCKLRLSDSFFKESSVNFNGRQVLDGIALLKNSFIRLEDYKLATAAQTYLKEKKLIEGDDRWKEIENAYKQDQQLLVNYNLKDSILAYDVLQESGALALTIQRSLLAGMPLERVSASIASLDSLYMRELKMIKVVAPSVQHQEKEAQTRGGFVMTSKPGIYNNILVHDFKSLYPSIMRTFNIDPYSYLGQNRKGKDVVTLVNHASFRNQDGILPRIIQHLWQQRDKAKRKNDQNASFAIKILMNSLYGVLANPNCRFFSSNLANAITHSGQHLIKLTAEKVREMGYEVIYGDTDSIFTDPQAKSLAEAKRIGKEIQDSINTFYDKHIKDNYNRKSFMELEFEKCFTKFMMPTVRHSTVGAKKRYAGIILKDGEEKLEFTGLEFVRSDWTALAKKFQLELLDKIFHEQEVTKFIKRFVESLRAGKYDDLVIYKKSIRKKLAEYTKTTPPHVKAARKLEAAGKTLKSSRILYIMTADGPEPIELKPKRIDYDHYIEKQLKPIADAVLSFYDASFEDIMKGSKQKTLFGF